MLEELGYQNFGKKAYWLFLSKWLQVPVGFLFIAVLSSIAGRTALIPVQFRPSAGMVSLACLAISVISAIVCVIASRVVFKNQQFCLAENAFKLRQGVLRSHEIAIPYRQIQNVEIERTLYQRMIGVSRIVISTAGEDDPATPEDESRAVLQDVDKDVALALQDDLLRKADVQRVVSAK